MRVDEHDDSWRTGRRARSSTGRERPSASFWAPGEHPVRAQDYVRDGGQDVLRAELAGCDPERDIEVTASCGVLTIRAERREDRRDRRRLP